MPEYLAPGVYVEETSFREKTVQGVSTSTAAFVRPCRFGRINGEPFLLTNYTDFEQIYDGLDKLCFDGQEATQNNVANAVRAFFKKGGRRLFVSRISLSIDGNDGVARWDPSNSFPSNSQERLIKLRAFYPGAAGEFSVTFTFNLGQSILEIDKYSNLELDKAGEGDIIWAQTKKEASNTEILLNQCYQVLYQKSLD